MIGSEAPVVIAKACEIFIRELTLQAWMHTEESKRRTLQVFRSCGDSRIEDRYQHGRELK